MLKGGRRRGVYRDIGLLIIRAGLGVVFVLHGYPKVFGGPEKWEEVGATMQYLGIEFAPMFFGFMAGAIELFGGLFLAFGLFFTPTLALMILVMAVAAAEQVATGGGLTGIAHPIELALVFLGLLFIGPGRYSLEWRINRRRRY
ncbi:MAG: DoxX family protein [Balneolaceae bacterium]|nr:DoxX family protein [Balneolaceae bacterium]